MNDKQTEAEQRFEEGLRILARIIAREHLRSMKAQEEGVQVSSGQQLNEARETKAAEEAGDAPGKSGPNREAGREKAFDG